MIQYNDLLQPLSPVVNVQFDGEGPFTLELHRYHTHEIVVILLQLYHDLKHHVVSGNGFIAVHINSCCFRASSSYLHLEGLLFPAKTGFFCRLHCENNTFPR
jgi:hypothetical protein